METRPSESDLRAARSAAVDAALRADELEAQARKARRIANAKQKHYDDMLLIAQGQMELPYEAEEAP